MHQCCQGSVRAARLTTLLSALQLKPTPHPLRHRALGGLWRARSYVERLSRQPTGPDELLLLHFVWLSSGPSHRTTRQVLRRPARSVQSLGRHG